MVHTFSFFLILLVVILVVWVLLLLLLLHFLALFEGGGKGSHGWKGKVKTAGREEITL